jgi:DNA-binding ferritin-like protein
MNILKTLVPYQSLFSFGIESVTGWWVLITVIFFIVSIIGLAVRRRKINNSIRLPGNKINENRIKSNTYLKSLWEKYEITFIVLEKNYVKSKEPSSNYFNLDSVLSQFLNLRYWVSLPNVFVGIGILGTFVGLALGLADFDPEKISDSINNLLPGMKTAFVTSIWGMLLSILFDFFEKWHFHKIDISIKNFAHLIDKKYLFSQAEQQSWEQQQLNLLFEQYFMVELGGDQKINIAHLFRDIKIEIEQQTKTLKAFSTDLADGITLSTKTIEQLGGNFAKALEDAIRNELSPAIRSMEQVLTELKNIKQDSSGQLIREIIQQLEKNLRDMITQLQTQLTGDTIKQLKDLANILGATSLALIKLPEKVDEMIQKMSVQIDDMGEAIKKIATKTTDAAETATEMINKNVEGSLENIKQSIHLLVTKIEEMSTRESEIIKNADKLNGQFTKKFEESQRLSSELNHGIEKANALILNTNHASERMLEGIRGITSSSNTLETTLRKYQQQEEKLNSTFNSILDQFRTFFDKSKTLSSDYVQKFQIIENGLSGIFNQIQTGLQEYQKVTEEQLNQSLTVFVGQCEKAAGGLHGSIESLKELFEEISDTLEKLRKQKI